VSDNIHYVICEEVGAKYLCQHCSAEFTRKASLNRHINNNCPVIAPNQSKGELRQQLHEALQQKSQPIETLQQQMQTMQSMQQQILESVRKMENQAQSPVTVNNTNINHQNLKVVCLHKDDNLLDILTAQDGLPKALTYIKNCALARLASDCQILEKVYQQNTGQPTITYEKKSKSRYIYYGKHRIKTFESNGAALAKKLAGILQRSYLKSMDCFRRDNDRKKYAPISHIPLSHADEIPELNEADAESITAHVHELNEVKYQMQLLKQLRIPFEDDIMNSPSE
jgi:hypothetical protein